MAGVLTLVFRRWIENPDYKDSMGDSVRRFGVAGATGDVAVHSKAIRPVWTSCEFAAGISTTLNYIN